MARLPLTHIGLSVVALVGLLSVSGPARAQDDSSDDDTFDFDDNSDDDGTEDVDVERLDDEDNIDDALPNEDDLKIAPEGEEGELDFEDEFDDDKDVGVQAEGQDTARIYRDYLTSVEDLGPDEESLAWERYVKKYPSTLFKSRIDERVEELSQEMYAERLGGPAGRFEDAGRAELNFAQPTMLESIDPRNNIRAGFEYGPPTWFGLMLTGEHQLTREWSVGGGVRSRFTGTNIEAGTKYALIKSARTQMLLTGIGDFHLNVNPMHLGFRPQVGFGKRFNLPNSMYLDAQLQAGADMLLIPGAFSPRLVGGANITIVPSKTVRAYIETSTYMKDMFWSESFDQTSFTGGIFRFNVVTFGIKFITRKGATTDRFETGIGASVPYTTNYWRYHQGAVTADTHFYY